jgi:hypothetical protein
VNTTDVDSWWKNQNQRIVLSSGATEQAKGRIDEAVSLACHFAFIVPDMTVFMSNRLGLHPVFQFSLRQTNAGMSYKSHKNHRYNK